MPMLKLIIFLVPIFIFCQIQLEKVDYKLKRNEVERIEYDSRINLENALKFKQLIINKYGNSYFTYVYKIDNVNYIIVDGAKESKDDYGLRVQHIQNVNEVLVIKYQSRGNMDAYNTDLYFFKTNNTYFIVAEHGAEYSYGLNLFTFENSTLKFYSDFEVGLYSKQAETIYHPIDSMFVYKKMNEYVVKFECDIIEYPGTDKQKIVERKNGQQLTYIFKNKKFKLVQ
mgnify:FL=1